jgi:HPt (histidine-containing phosphotransfer) domain-containing protein
MNLLFSAIILLLILGWLTWLVTYIYGQKRSIEAARLAGEQQARFGATTLPVKLQAVERLILLLERIRPDGLVHRTLTDQPASAMQLQLLAQMRAEFEHNLAQQVYVKRSTWIKVLHARDQVAGAIQQAGSQLPIDGPGILFARQLLQQQAAANESIEEAVAALRQELDFRQYV